MWQNCSHDSHSFSFWKKQVWPSEKEADSTGKWFSIPCPINKLLIVFLLFLQIVCLVHMKLFHSKRIIPTSFSLEAGGREGIIYLFPTYAIYSSYCHYGTGSCGCLHQNVKLYSMHPKNYLEFPPVCSPLHWLFIYASKFFPEAWTKINCSDHLTNTDSI